MLVLRIYVCGIKIALLLKVIFKLMLKYVVDISYHMILID